MIDPFEFGSWRKSSRSGNESSCVELAWRKSSRSGDQSSCVELAWRKSSRSGNEGSCVELALDPQAGPGAIRDSKNPAGGMLRASFGALITAVKADRFTP